jgi:hypothetical protein
MISKPLQVCAEAGLVGGAVDQDPAVQKCAVFKQQRIDRAVGNGDENEMAARDGLHDVLVAGVYFNDADSGRHAIECGDDARAPAVAAAEHAGGLYAQRYGFNIAGHGDSFRT